MLSKSFTTFFGFFSIPGTNFIMSNFLVFSFLSNILSVFANYSSTIFKFLISGKFLKIGLFTYDYCEWLSTFNVASSLIYSEDYFTDFLSKFFSCFSSYKIVLFS